MNGSEALDVDVAVGAHRTFNLLGRCAVDVDEYGVARAEHIVLRRCHVHAGLEGEVFAVENVASEHFLLLFLALLEDFFEHGNGIHGHQSAQLHLHLQEVVVVLVVGVAPHAFALHALRGHFLGFLLRRVLARAVVGLAHGFVGHHAQSGLLFLAVGNLLHAPNLLDVHAALHEFRHDLFLRGAGLVFFQHEANHLVVGHRRLGHCAQRHQQSHQHIDNFLLHISFYGYLTLL